MRLVFLWLAGFLLAGNLHAHDVLWWENLFGDFPMEFYFPDGYSGYFYVYPESGEPCTVVVNLNPIASTLVSAFVLPPNPANIVEVRVLILRAPSNGVETATITGEWHATGIPAGAGCTATTPNPFSVPIVVGDQSPAWHLSTSENNRCINLDTGLKAALQSSDCLTGPFINVGIGQTFSLRNEGMAKYFKRSRMVGGYVGGVVWDSSDQPIPGLKMDLLDGGAPASVDSYGWYSFPHLPQGMNEISLTNPIGAVLNVMVPNTNNTTANFVVEMAAEEPDTNAPVTNVCNCTPWCAIGFGTLANGQTPVYYSGGAHSPPNVPATCDEPEVVVIPPTGDSYSIKPGSRRSQNSGPNPASGDWTVIASVCGLIKSATVTVP